MDVSCGGHGGEEEFAKMESEGVAHCIYENVGNEKEECVDGEEKRAQGLAEEGEVWPSGCEHVVAGGEVKEMEGRWV